MSTDPSLHACALLQADVVQPKATLFVVSVQRAHASICSSLIRVFQYWLVCRGSAVTVRAVLGHS